MKAIIIDLSVRYIMKEPYKVLCFKHAAIEAVKNNKDIEVEIDEFGMSGNDMRQTHCDECIKG